MFALQKPAKAIDVLREAYALDKKNSLARAILSNALVEHARSFVETDWLEAEKLTNQALSLNPAHPTAKTILSLIVQQKTTSPVDDWVSQAGKLQSAGDLFAALAWVAEGLAVHPHDPKLLQMQDAIQRDQDARRRQTRRRDMEDLRHMEAEIASLVDVAAKTALAERIQGLAARYWTDGEILSIANTLLLRLGLIPKGNSTSYSHGKGAAVIFHVPRPNAPAKRSDIGPVPPVSVAPVDIVRTGLRSQQVRPENARSADAPPLSSPAVAIPSGKVQSSQVPSGPELPRIEAQKFDSVNVDSPGVIPQKKISAHSPEPQVGRPVVAVLAETESLPVRVPASSEPDHPQTRSNPGTLILVGAAAAIVAVAGTLFFAQRHYAPLAATAPAAASAVSTPAESARKLPATDVSAPVVTAPIVAAPARSASAPIAEPTPEPSLAAASSATDTAAGKKSSADESAESAQRKRIAQRKTSTATPAKLIFNPQPQPQPRPSMLTIQGGVPGTAVLIDQTLVGTIPANGTLSVSNVNPGDHAVELRKERFKPRELRKHFVGGEAISLAAADSALEAAPAGLKINFTPADAQVAIVKGDHLTMISSGVPLNLDAGTYTLTARTADGYRSSATLEVVAGQSKTLALSLAPGGMSSWADPGSWKHEKDAFIRKGGNFVLYAVAPASGTFAFSAMPVKGHLLQWVFNYADAKNYVLFQMDDANFYRTVIRNGQKTDEIKVAEKNDKKSFRELRIRVSATELVHQIKHGDRWIILDRWTQPVTDLSLGKFGFYIPGDDEVALSSFTYYADLNIR